MLSESGRTEKRTKLTVEVRLLSLQSLGIVEDTQMDNVSTRGARVLTTQPRLPQEPLLVASTDGTFQTQARVVYCKRLPDRRYAVGLKFERRA